MTNETFEQLGLSKPILRALGEAGYEKPTPIQAQAIPLLLDDHDLLGIAQTGTGKTAAFTLPLIDNLLDDNKRAAPKQAGALILAPTRELVIQIADNIKAYARHTPIRIAIVMGGVNMGSQIKAMQKGVDILLATPGRLLDMLQQKHVDLSQTEFLVLDEADRMLDMGFIRDVRKIVARLPDERQTMLFSATMPAEITKLANEILYQPKRVEIAAKSVAVDRIAQEIHHVSVSEKASRLASLLAGADVGRSIVFTRTKRGANKVMQYLDKAGFSAEAIHGNKSQSARQKTLENFRSGRASVLVATDIASRGIDIDDVTHVFNYELPHEPESYVHRIGRTARNGMQGIAISLCSPDERSQLRSIERLIKQSIPVVGSSAESVADVPPEGERSSGGERSDGPRKGRSRNGRKRNAGQKNGRQQQTRQNGERQTSERPSGERPSGERTAGERQPNGRKSGERNAKKPGNSAPRAAQEPRSEGKPRRRTRRPRKQAA